MAGAEVESSSSDAAAKQGYFSLMLFLGGLYITTSAGLIAFNKFLMHKDRFPYAIALVMIHAAFCSASTFILYLVKPSLFPSLTDPARKVPIDRDLVLKGALPIGVLFCAQLVLSNTAYLHSSVAFVQMMQEANLVLVYTLSLIAALEHFTWRNFCVLVFIMCATTMTIHGELNFSWTGFCIQGLSQIFECPKIVLSAMLLTSAGRKLDALTYVLLVMPICFLVLVVGLCFLLFVRPIEHLATPQMADVVHWSPVLLLNACVALALNVIIALFVKHSSAVAFILAGIVKDACIVGAGTMFFEEIVSTLQFIGFGLQLCGILFWSLTKSFPEKFEKGVVAGLLDVLFGIGSDAPEKVPGYGAIKAESKC